MNRTLDPQTDAAVQRFRALVSAEYKVARVAVFGSRARGTHNAESDVDVAVLLDGAAGAFVDTKLAMANVAVDVLIDTGILISPWPVWMEEWEHPDRYANPALLHNIARDGVWI